MNLAKTNLPLNVVVTLREFNIREVEALLSMVATPTGLLGIARVLGMPVEAVRELALELRAASPPAAPAYGPFHPMGHHPPSAATGG